jgi:hypothetical protein
MNNTESLSSHDLASITDDYMKARLSETKPFTAIILKKGLAFHKPDSRSVIWEHGRRNLLLKSKGLLPIVCPVNDGTEVAGIGLFTTDEEETKLILEEDPAVKAGALIYELHPTISFPGSILP